MSFCLSNLVLRLALPFLILNRTRLAYRVAGSVVKLHTMLLLLRQIVARRMQLRTLDNSGSSTILGASRVRAGDVRARALACRIASNPCGNENEPRLAAVCHIRGSSNAAPADHPVNSTRYSDEFPCNFRRVQPLQRYNSLQMCLRHCLCSRYITPYWLLIGLLFRGL
jgi:hypothetical protein